MTAPSTRTRRSDIKGGLEVVRDDTVTRGQWRIRLSGQDVDVRWSQGRRRNAIALREFLVAVIPDWSSLSQSDAGQISFPKAARPELRRIEAMVDEIADRTAWSQCRLCGRHLHSIGECSPPRLGDPIRYTPAEVSWAR